MSPAVIALIVYSCYRLARLGMEDRLQWVIAAGCFVVTVALQAEAALLFLVSGAIGIAYYGTLFRRRSGVPPLPLLAGVAAKAGAVIVPTGSILGQLAVFFQASTGFRVGIGLDPHSGSRSLS